MKKYFIILTGIVFSLNIFANDDLKTFTDSAFNYYLEGDYDNALRIYSNLYEQDYSSADLYYNMGNCYYKNGDIANAVYFYEKAHILKPGDKDIDHNLKIATSNIRNKVEKIPEVFYVTWYNNFISIMSSDSWAVISIVFFVTSLLLVILFLFSRKIIIRKTGFILGIIFFITSIMSFIFAKSQAHLINNNTYAIVFEPSMVKSSPSEDSMNLFEINEGLKVEVIDSINIWINVRLADGKEGWVPGKNIKRL
ncbi:MAG: tetratricopeptide repeat protein [Bacteroidales bacterium]|jgi:tetratricopeptide (TPR) repeat protein|nr:tetratricopeptide repeat protein [Bacteroidales bacterium]